MTVPGDSALWSKIVSPSLRALIPGVTNEVSPLITESLPLEQTGDVIITTVCISRGAPAEKLAGWAQAMARHTEAEHPLLLSGALEAVDFYDFPEGSLVHLFYRLKRNVDSSEADSPQEEAHNKILERFEHVIIGLAAQHPRAAEWLTRTRKEVAVTPSGQRFRPIQKRSRAKLTVVR